MHCFTFHKWAGLISAFVLLVFSLDFHVLAQEGRVEFIEVTGQGLKENLLGDSAIRNVTVYLPPKYDEEPDRRYPAVYLLHGYTGDNRLWTDRGYVKGLDVPAIANRLITSGHIQPMILVAPDCHNQYRGSWYTNSPVTGNWEDFVAKDLVRHTDEKYRTVRRRESRGIAGHSMGGHGAIKIAMKHPDLFSVLYAMSPAAVNFNEIVKKPFTKNFIQAAETKRRDGFDKIHWRSQAMIALAAAVAPNPKHEPFYGELPIDAQGNRLHEVWERWLKHDLSTEMLSEHGNNLKKYKAVAIDCGTEEDLRPSIMAFVDALEKAGIEHSFEEFKGGHSNRVVSQFEKNVLPFFSNILRQQQRTVSAETVR